MPNEIARALDESVEDAVNDWIEQRHAHEICLNEPDNETNYE